MTRWLRLLVVCVIAGAIVQPVGAYEGVGTMFALGSSGRGLGMGGALLALADDEGCVFYSPASLGRYEGIGITSGSCSTNGIMPRLSKCLLSS